MSDNEKFESVLKSVRLRVIPKVVTKEPSIFKKLLSDILVSHNIDADVFFGGSFAKGTFLPEDHDVDTFVRFDKKYSENEISDLLGLVLAGLGKAQRIRGSRDYFQMNFNKVLFEIIPVFKIDSPKDAKNLTDLSPLHVNFVKDNIAKNPSLATEIRICKLFCKGIKVYGAESYINGFSGHVVDLLTIYYGSFVNLLKNASKWFEHEKVFIDSLNEFSDSSCLNSSRTVGPLVLVDPIQRERNAAAALSFDKFSLFCNKARKFLLNPCVDFFSFVPLSKAIVLSKFSSEKVFFYELFPLQGNKDIVGTKLLKVHEFFVKELNLNGFSVVDNGFEFFGAKAFCFVVLKELVIKKEFVQKGPPVSQKSDSERFKEAHSSVFSKGGFLFANRVRKFTSVKDFFDFKSKSSFFNSRINNSKLI